MTRLHLDSTGITGGWHRLQGLPLQTLVISFTSFPHLPALPGLTCLCLSSSIYPPPPAPTNAELSECLAPKTKLQLLTLDNCGLAAVPSVVSLLTRLTTLDLSGNHIAAGREHLGALTRLVHLHPRSDSEYSD